MGERFGERLEREPEIEIGRELLKEACLVDALNDGPWGEFITSEDDDGATLTCHCGGNCKVTSRALSC